MKFDRGEAKLAARESMARNKPSPLLAALVHIVLVMAVSGALDLLVQDPVQEAMSYLQWGYRWDEIVQFVFLSDPAALGLFGTAALLRGVFQLLMGFGFTSYALGMARNRQPSLARLFDGFPRLLQVVGLGLLTGLFTTLWALALLIPAGGVVLIVFHLSGSQDAQAALTVSVFLAMLFMAARTAVGYRYRLAPFFLADDPDCTPFLALRRSRETMVGWKLELFFLDLSFLGWILLLILTGGVLGVWVNPYTEGTMANFYDAVRTPDAKVETGAYTGGIYGTPPQDPGPF